MYTGIVEALGEIVDLAPEPPGMRVTIHAPDALSADPQRRPIQIGDSVSINGCCLTVVEIEGNHWSFQAGPETLSRTNLGDFAVGDVVNLERPLQAAGELGGHFVQGHVDGLAKVDKIEPDGEWTEMWFRLPGDLSRMVVPKGSIAVDGVSLTVVDVETERFSVALIPHTLQVTTLGVRNVGDSVNIETDILAKHVDRLLALREQHV